MQMSWTLGNTIGAAYIGMVASAILFGVANLQTFMFFRMYPREKLYIKIAVVLLLILDGLSLFLNAHAVYHYLVDNFGRYTALLTIVWSVRLQVVVNVVIICSVQTLYAMRMSKFSELGAPYLKWITWLVWSGLACGYGIGIVLIIETYAISNLQEINEIRWAIFMSFGASTIIDFMIAVAMCFYLQQGRSTSGYSYTNSMVSTLTQYVLCTGVVTSVCSTTSLVAFAVMPHNLIFLSIQFSLTKLYVNSFLAMLNARKSLRLLTEAGEFVSNGRSHPTIRTSFWRSLKPPPSISDSEQVMTLTLREDEFDSTIEIEPEHSAPRVAVTDDIRVR